MSEVLLAVEGLKVHFPVVEGVLISKTVGSVKAVDGVSFQIHKGETFSLVGESGCGKSTTALAVLRMLDPTAGKVTFNGTDLTALSRQSMRPYRQEMQMVYQDPFGSLNPRMKVQSIVGEPLKVHRPQMSNSDYKKRVADLLDLVGLLPAMAERYPHEFSGGQRQRIAIARALALEPQLIICDEAVSALDVSIQAQVINLLMHLQRELGLSYLFISHDLSVVRHIRDRVGVMYLGQIVELKKRDDLFSNPEHPYTKTLLDAVPIANPKLEAERAEPRIIGEVPSVRNPPPGCRFNTRCEHATDRCRTEAPAATSRTAGFVACHLFADAATDASSSAA